MDNSNFYITYCFSYIFNKFNKMCKSRTNYYVYDNNEWIKINFKVFMIQFSCKEHILSKYYLCEHDNNYIFVYTTLNELPNINFNHEEHMKFYKDNIKFKKFINSSIVEISVSENDLNKFMHYSTHDKAITNLFLILNTYYNYGIDYIEYNTESIHVQHVKLNDLFDNDY